MSVFLAILAGLFVLALLVSLFMRTDAARLASALRFAGPAVLALGGVGLMLVGRAAVGGMLLSGAAAWYGAGQRRKRAKPTPGRRSSVRTAALEMELDHDSGALEGQVLAGTYEGQMLGTLELNDLLKLMQQLSSDSESVRLLETIYGGFPAWRDNAKAKMDAGVGSAPAPGPMSKEEAYKILGLEATATAADIRQGPDRRLMQRLHPDLGGSTFLAARINEAKDVLLSHHS